MAKIDVMTADGGKAGTADLDDAVFGIEPNTAVMHQVVNAQLAARRALPCRHGLDDFLRHDLCPSGQRG